MVIKLSKQFKIYVHTLNLTKPISYNDKQKSSMDIFFYEIRSRALLKFSHHPNRLNPINTKQKHMQNM